MVVDIFDTDKKYKVIYADPPWNYKDKALSGNRGAGCKYPVMSTEDICKLPVNELATDDSILFMWATFPNIAEALKVIKAWGFIYKTAGFVWVKKNKSSWSNFWGMGAYTRANAEVCLLAIRQGTKAKQIVKDHGVHQIIESRIEEHSKKPADVRKRIERLTGGGLPMIELFARQEVKGWDCWGNEV